jgi:hypothetical protein
VRFNAADHRVMQIAYNREIEIPGAGVRFHGTDHRVMIQHGIIENPSAGVRFSDTDQRVTLTRYNRAIEHPGARTRPASLFHEPDQQLPQLATATNSTATAASRAATAAPVALLDDALRQGERCGERT